MKEDSENYRIGIFHSRVSISRFLALFATLFNFHHHNDVCKNVRNLKIVKLCDMMR